MTTLDRMHRPTGWRPTAFYRPNGKTTAYTNGAILEDGMPAREVVDPVDGSGILLRGRWVLVSYDENWGHAHYARPDGWGDDPAAFRLASQA